MKAFIRAARPEDAPALLAVYAPYVQNTAVTFEYDVPTLPEFRERVEGTLRRYPWLVAEADGCILGYAYTGAFGRRAAYGWCAETSIYLRQDARGRGLGAELYRALEAVSRAQGLRSLIARVAAPEREDEYLTLASARFHQRMGYALAGELRRCGCKFGRWYGMRLYEKQLTEPFGTPEPTTPFPELTPEALAAAGIGR